MGGFSGWGLLHRGSEGTMSSVSRVWMKLWRVVFTFLEILKVTLECRLGMVV